MLAPQGLGPSLPPERTGKPPRGTPPGCGAAGLKPYGFGSSRGLLGHMFRLLRLVSGEGAWGQDQPGERVSESPRRELLDCTVREACLRTLGPFTRLL